MPVPTDTPTSTDTNTPTPTATIDPSIDLFAGVPKPNNTTFDYEVKESKKTCRYYTSRATPYSVVNNYANLLAEMEPQLKELSKERAALAEEIASIEAHAKKLNNDNIALEAQVMNLKDKVYDVNQLRQELAEVTESRQDISQQVRSFANQLETANTAKVTLEKNLTEAYDALRALRIVVKELKEKLAYTEGQVVDAQIQLEQQQAENRDLMAAKARLEDDARMSELNHETIKKELTAIKQAMRDIHSEASRTSGRVRQLYLKPKDAKKRSNRAKNTAGPLPKAK